MELEEGFFETTDYKQTDVKIGEGSFGPVYLVEKIEDKSKYAAKILNLPMILSGNDQFKLMRESTKLKNLNHPAIVKFYGINFHSFNEPKLLQPTILTEYLQGGSLKSILNKQKGNKNENISSDELLNGTRKYIFLLGISSALNYMHEKGIFHRNLEPKNIFINEKKYPKVKIFDFSQNLSTSTYTSPELFENKDQKIPGADIYSFAIIAYEIISGKKAYEKFKSIDEFKEKVKSGYRPEFNENFTQKMKELLSQCWNQDIYKRPSFEEIFNKLSSDFSYLKEQIDEEEIKKYLSFIEKVDNICNSMKDNNNNNCNDISQKRKINRLLHIIKKLSENTDNIQNLYFRSLNGNMLHVACESGDLKLVKILLSYDIFDITDKTI